MRFSGRHHFDLHLIFTRQLNHIDQCRRGIHITVFYRAADNRNVLLSQWIATLFQANKTIQTLEQDGKLMYTRDGSFQMNQNGDVVTSSGYLLEPNVNVPHDATSISITQDGAVYVSQPGNVDLNQVGQIELASFMNPAGLESMGHNFYKETTASGTPNINNPQTAEAGGLTQGALEASNVNTVEELIGMIEAQRTYEMNSKAISAADGMMQYLNNNT